MIIKIRNHGNKVGVRLYNQSRIAYRFFSLIAIFVGLRDTWRFVESFTQKPNLTLSFKIIFESKLPSSIFLILVGIGLGYLGYIVMDKPRELDPPPFSDDEEDFNSDDAQHPHDKKTNKH